MRAKLPKLCKGHYLRIAAAQANRLARKPKDYGPIYGFVIDSALSDLVRAMTLGIGEVQKKTFGKGPTETVKSFLAYLSEVPGLPHRYVADLHSIRKAHATGLGELVARFPGGHWSDRPETSKMHASNARANDAYLKLTSHIALSHYIVFFMEGRIPVRDWVCEKHLEAAEEKLMYEDEIRRENRLWKANLRDIFPDGEIGMTDSEREVFGS